MSEVKSNSSNSIQRGFASSLIKPIRVQGTNASRPARLVGELANEQHGLEFGLRPLKTKMYTLTYACPSAFDVKSDCDCDLIRGSHSSGKRNKKNKTTSHAFSNLPFIIQVPVSGHPIPNAPPTRRKQKDKKIYSLEHQRTIDPIPQNPQRPSILNTKTLVQQHPQIRNTLLDFQDNLPHLHREALSLIFIFHSIRSSVDNLVDRPEFAHRGVEVRRVREGGAGVVPELEGCGRGEGKGV